MFGRTIQRRIEVTDLDGRPFQFERERRPEAAQRKRFTAGEVKAMCARAAGPPSCERQEEAAAFEAMDEAQVPKSRQYILAATGRLTANTTLSVLIPGGIL
jgi:hypothetical protein